MFSIDHNIIACNVWPLVMAANNKMCMCVLALAFKLKGKNSNIGGLNKMNTNIILIEKVNCRFETLL